MVHGFGQCSDVFFEMALHLALNGFIVHMVDLDGFGYSGGKRIAGLRIERMHAQVTSLLTEARADLPLFLLGHSMGCLVVNSYLGFNPKIAQQLAGVIFSAPLYGVPDFANMDPVKKAVIKAIGPLLEDFVMIS